MQITKPVILIGGGGHAKVLLDALRLLNAQVIGIVDSQLKKGTTIDGATVIGTDDDVFLNYKPREILLVNAVGSVNINRARKDIYDRFKAKQFSFSSVVHPSSIIAKNVFFGEGVQIMAGAVIQTGTMIRDNSIINTRASIDHDCVIESHVHIAPGAVLCGGIHVGEGAHVGAGAVIIQNCRIETQTLVRAGKTFTGIIIPGLPRQEKLL